METKNNRNEIKRLLFPIFRLICLISLKFRVFFELNTKGEKTRFVMAMMMNALAMDTAANRQNNVNVPPPAFPDVAR